MSKNMLKIIQSNKIETLFDSLLEAYTDPTLNQAIFEPFNVIVPSKVMGEWLKKQVADKAGISTLVTTEFWGRYYLTLLQRVLRTYSRYRDDVLEVPEVAMLSKSIMQWQIFGFLLQNKELITHNKHHPLYPFVELFIEDKKSANSNNNTQNMPAANGWANNQSLLSNNIIADTAQAQTFEQRVWQLANDMAGMLNRYMTYRPQWLETWGQNQPLAIQKMIADKDALHNRIQGRHDEDAIETPSWLVEYYQQLEAAQRFLWLTLFDDDYRYRQQLQQQFWQALAEEDAHVARICQSRLPKHILLFTIQQLPPSELLDLQRLAQYVPITLLHFNPSEQFWADIVDKNWLLQQQLENPDSLYLKDYGHTLLSRFGKQSREVFAMLANLSGNEFEQVIWEDKFIDDKAPKTLLNFIQQDILMLEETNTQQKIKEMLQLTGEDTTARAQDVAKLPLSQRPQISQTFKSELLKIQQSALTQPQLWEELRQKLQEDAEKQQAHKAKKWQSSTLDSSLSIHVCHSIGRQLEVLRTMIVSWLNYTDMEENPDLNPEELNRQRSVSDILVLLPNLDEHQNIIEAIFPRGEGTDGYYLPAKVTGVVAKDINQLWQAIMGYYQLLNKVGARFSRAEVFDWLMLAPLYESFGLNLEQMSRGCELLQKAGFIRGFDEVHLQQTLNQADDDYRYSFAYALERLVAGVIMPNASEVSFGEYTNQYGEKEKILPLDSVTMADASIIAVLCDIYQTLNEKRDLGKMTTTADKWLKEIEGLIQTKFAIFNQTNAWRAIFAAQNDLKNNIDANHQHTQRHNGQEQNAATTNPHYSVNISSLTSSQVSAPNRIATEHLPLKLGFVLESIAQQLVSQQVSAEPSGVITFARIGTVRNLPYKLIVLLNMNLSEFPQQEQQNRYNLMQAGLPIRGDRFREDDDLGAFLDALLCAQEACWLFYNGKSTTDTHEHLPASPLQELLGFLQTKLDIEMEETDDDAQKATENNNSLSDNKKTNFGQQVENYLTTHHAALPFDKSYFEMDIPQQKVIKASDNTTAEMVPTDVDANMVLNLAKTKLYPPARIWHNLYTELQAKDAANKQAELVPIWQKSQLQQWLETWRMQQVSLASYQQVLPPIYISLDTIIRGLQNPAKAFIQEQNLFVHVFDEADTIFEPIAMDNLATYQLNAILLKQFLTHEAKSITTATDGQASKATTSLMYNDILPAGVNRYQSLQQQQRQMTDDLIQLVVNLQNFTTQDNAPEFTGLTDFIHQQFPLSLTTPEKNTSRIINAIGNSITANHEQRLSIEILAIDEKGSITEQKQNMILTVALPSQLGNASESNRLECSHWIQYLPTSGREKYQLQFWLNHLCWQVARQTTPEQVEQQDGWSLWQYSNKKTLFLPPITYEKAYAWLQNSLMIWQLLRQVVVILPPQTTMSYLKQQRDNPDETAAKLLGDWFKSAFEYRADENQFLYPIWQQLLGSRGSLTIVPFIETLGNLLYMPILEQMIDLFEPKKATDTKDEAKAKTKKHVSKKAKKNE